MSEINKKHEKEILKVIGEYPIFSFKDIFTQFKGCSRATAYNHGLDKLDSIKEAIYQNKRVAITSLLQKWINSDNATLNIAAMRLLCDEHEHRLLNQQYIENKIG